jgi:hypothetical protein
MNLDPNEVVNAAAAIIAERAWQEIAGKIDAVACISINRAAAALDISASQCRRLLTEHVDFGDKATRVSLKQLGALIESRTVKLK